MAEADPGRLAAATPVRELAVANATELDAALRGATEPFVVRGLVADWPLVRAGRTSATAARDYLLAHAQPRQFTVAVGAAEGAGKLFYGDDMAVNFRTLKAPLNDIFARMDATDAGETIYLSSIDMHEYFAGLAEENRVPLGDRQCRESIWIGTATSVAAHNDVPANLACVAVGRRRFTLFPRDQFANLYLGPIDNTPAGRSVSMVDLDAPDYARHPCFAAAAAHAQVVELEPGDALHIPALWWHAVEGLGAFNVLVNFWWRETPRFLGEPQDAMLHAMLAVRDLPADQKDHWRAMFDHYVFGDVAAAAAHLPDHAQGVLAPLTAETASRLRSYLLRQLSR